MGIRLKGFGRWGSVCSDLGLQLSVRDCGGLNKSERGGIFSIPRITEVAVPANATVCISKTRRGLASGIAFSRPMRRGE